MHQANIIGDIGENTFALRLSKGGIFKVYFLGEKAPVVDYMLEIIDINKQYQCFVQVKSTNQEIKYNNDGWMRTPVPADKLRALIARPLPTYVAGVDIENEVVFVAPAFENNGEYPAIPPRLRFDKDNANTKVSLERLRDDIIRFWEESGIIEYKRDYNSNV